MDSGDMTLDGRYQIVRYVAAGLGDKRIRIGQKGRCRFCGCTSEGSFRKEAHTFPEALGNKWVFSLDECDGCNAKFSAYECELVNSVAPLLTLAGVQGKKNRIRQTARTGGDFTARRDGKGLRILVSNHELERFVSVDLLTGHLRLEVPVAGVPFRPRLAYKALCKMALAILPDEELCHYSKLRRWIRDTKETLDFPLLDVGLSLAGC